MKIETSRLILQLTPNLVMQMQLALKISLKIKKKLISWKEKKVQIIHYSTKY